VTSARMSRDRIDRLLRFWVAVAALAGVVVFGAAAVSELGIRAWVPGVLCVLLAVPCVLILVLNIVVETAGYAVSWLRVIGTVLALPLLMVPGVRQWIDRLWLRHNTSEVPQQPRAWAPQGHAGVASARPAGPALYPRANYTLPEQRNGRLVVASPPPQWQPHR